MTNNKLRVALLISGGGTTAEAVIKAALGGDLNITPAVVVASKNGAGGIDKANSLEIPTEV